MADFTNRTPAGLGGEYSFGKGQRANFADSGDPSALAENGTGTLQDQLDVKRADLQTDPSDPNAIRDWDGEYQPVDENGLTEKQGGNLLGLRSRGFDPIVQEKANPENVESARVDPTKLGIAQGKKGYVQNEANGLADTYADRYSPVTGRDPLRNDSMIPGDTSDSGFGAGRAQQIHDALIASGVPEENIDPAVYMEQSAPAKQGTSELAIKRARERDGIQDAGNVDGIVPVGRVPARKGRRKLGDGREIIGED